MSKTLVIGGVLVALLAMAAVSTWMLSPLLGWPLVVPRLVTRTSWALPLILWADLLLSWLVPMGLVLIW